VALVLAAPPYSAGLQLRERPAGPKNIASRTLSLARRGKAAWTALLADFLAADPPLSVGVSEP